jgi:sterol 24-C-methyltransferase
LPWFVFLALNLNFPAPDRKAIYSEVLRVIKPGSRFAMYEWCMTDKYNPDDAEHNEIRHGVEVFYFKS